MPRDVASGKIIVNRGIAAAHGLAVKSPRGTILGLPMKHQVLNVS